MPERNTPAAMLPRHIAIIMDGNGRWAKQRGQVRMAGHRAGIESVRRVVQSAAEKGIEVLTLFAFGQENWRRPKQEISYLHSLLFSALQRELAKLMENNIRLRFIGDLAALQPKLQQQLQMAVEKTHHNTGMWLVIAFNYSGQWDITEAARKVAVEVQAGHLSAQSITQVHIANQLSTADLPLPDLFIRTSGEYRLSNFLLWQLAYAELYFTPIYWPDFTEADLEKALAAFAQRERRFGAINDIAREADTLQKEDIIIEAINYLES